MSDALRIYVKRTLSNLFEAQEAKYFIKFSPKKKVFILYKRFKGYDRFKNYNEQIVVVQELSSNPTEAEKQAKEITGQDIQVKLPGESKVIERAKVVLPFNAVKGKRIEEVPLPQLVQFIIHAKWISALEKEPYKKAIYLYLTQDKATETKSFLEKFIAGLPLSNLIEWYNLRVSREIYPEKESVVFAWILLPLMKEELIRRGVQFHPSGEAIYPRT